MIKSLVVTVEDGTIYLVHLDRNPVVNLWELSGSEVRGIVHTGPAIGHQMVLLSAMAVMDKAELVITLTPPVMQIQVVKGSGALEQAAEQMAGALAALAVPKKLVN